MSNDKPSGDQAQMQTLTLLAIQGLQAQLAAMEQSIERLSAEAKAVAESTAKNVAAEVVQNALEAFQQEEPTIRSSVPASRTGPTASMTMPKSRPRLDSLAAKPGARCMSKSGNNNYFPVIITAGPFLNNGKPSYSLKRLDGAKGLTPKPLTELFFFTDEEAVLWSETPLRPKTSRSK